MKMKRFCFFLSMTLQVASIFHLLFPSLISFKVNCCKLFEKHRLSEILVLAKKKSLNCTRVYLWHHNELITRFLSFASSSLLYYFFPSPSLFTIIIFSYGMVWRERFNEEKERSVKEIDGERKATIDSYWIKGRCFILLLEVAYLAFITVNLSQCMWWAYVI